MLAEPKLSHTAAMILQAIHTGYLYGFSVMEVTGQPGGTAYPAMRRLERDWLIRGEWERQPAAEAGLRPSCRHSKLTRSGRATLDAADQRYPLLPGIVRALEAEKA
jgi:PadR family transcriptional regulator, regulatory protein PadR